MSLANLVDRNILKAFNLLGDLATDGTFQIKNGVDFDFASAEVTTTASTTVTTKVVVIDGEKKSSKSNTMRKNILFKSKEITDVKLYDKVTIDGIEWDLGPILRDGGYIVLADIYREV